jgi:phosphatidylinositol glycan class B
MIKGIIQSQARTLLICIAISLALYMTAAWKSAIYLHPDEYYQIVEFASYKMHITAPDQMAWEFGEKIRPAFQPMMCYGLLKTFNAFNITDHFMKLYLLRVLSALLSLFSITLFCVSSLPFISEAYRRVYIIASFLFWYPYTYGVHFSSETWSGCMILISVSLVILYYLGEIRKPFLVFTLIGLLLGAAFLLRFQTAFISMGILTWLLFEKKERSQLLTVIAAGAAMLFAGVLLDHWFYGEWLCTPWRYFDSAFIHKHSEFGSQPFYFFPLFMTLMLTPPIGLLIVISVLIFFYTQPRTLYTWALLPFLLLHTIIGHKEFRFMYPVISFFPLVVVMAYQGLREKKGWTIPRWILTTTKVSLVIFNLLCIVIFVFFADRFLFDSKVFLSKIHDIAKEKKVVVYCKDINNSPYALPKATIPRDLYPIYALDASVSNVFTSNLTEVPASKNDTARLIVCSQAEWAASGRSDNSRIKAQTLMNLMWLKPILGNEAYKGISENTYYFVEL